MKTDTLLEYLKKNMFDNKGKYFPYNISPESSVLPRRGIRDIITSQKSKWTTLIAASGYPILIYNSNDEAKSFLAKEKDLDAAIVVDTWYSLNKYGVTVLGFNAGSVTAQVNMNITVFDRNGNVVMQDTVEGESKNSIKQVMGWYKVSDVNNICKEATDEALTKYAKWIKEQKVL